jgi:hypothetical protein
MPKGICREIIPAPKEQVFALVHDYQRRLEWDTLLRKAYLEPEFSEAGLGAISVCQGRQMLGGFALRTVYVSFQKGKVAAVKMLNQPPFFETFAASIRHFDAGENQSEVVYEFHFTAKPKWLRWILHPVMKAALDWETKKRLKALKKFFSRQKS